MPICSLCGYNKSSTYAPCPNCKQLAAIQKQTKAQNKFYKDQKRAAKGAGSGGGVIEGFFALLYHMTVLSWKITAFTFVFAYNLIKPFYEQNPVAFKKWAKIVVGTSLGIVVALALLGGYLNGWK